MIGETIKYWREKRGLTQQQLADLVGLKDVKIIGKYENGKKNPSLEPTLNKILSALEVGMFFKSIKK